MLCILLLGFQEKHACAYYIVVCSCMIYYSVMVEPCQCICIHMLLATYIFLCRIVKLTSPNLNYVVLVGAFFLYSSIYFYVLPSREQLNSTVYCHVSFFKTQTWSQLSLIDYFSAALTFYIAECVSMLLAFIQTCIQVSIFTDHAISVY